MTGNQEGRERHKAHALSQLLPLGTWRRGDLRDGVALIIGVGVTGVFSIPKYRMSSIATVMLALANTTNEGAVG